MSHECGTLLKLREWVSGHLATARGIATSHQQPHCSGLVPYQVTWRPQGIATSHQQPHCSGLVPYQVTWQAPSAMLRSARDRHYARIRSLAVAKRFTMQICEMRPYP